jgi:phosphopantothenoylcysteine decarboxylase / phosphopantothenate---cysteine ligase
LPSVVLGVCGSIAAYRAADLARDLMRDGYQVRTCLTDAAQKFVTPILFETLTGNPCLQDVFEEPERGRMAHLDWARQADLLLIAPASASAINRIANGVGDDMLATIVLAFERPIVIAPAMNPAMYLNAETQASLAKLVARGCTIVEPHEGDVVEGEHGPGKLAPNAEILAVVKTIACRAAKLQGKRVLITSGPTQEPIDDVRYLTNRSSGKMGAALAQAALWMGAEVTVVAGPSSVQYPRLAKVVSVRTAQEMLGAAQREADAVDVIIGAAAVADYRPATKHEGKLRRSDKRLSLELVPNPDIIAELAKSGKATIGFAAEPSPELEQARAKIRQKGLRAIAHNDVSNAQIGFESNENEVTLIFEDGRSEKSPQGSKLSIALWILERVAI